jgi:cytochrome c553
LRFSGSSSQPSSRAATAKHPEAPNIAGQIENYLAKTLHQYRSGERRNEMMTIAAKELTDKEIEDLSAFYAAIQIEVIPP